MTKRRKHSVARVQVAAAEHGVGPTPEYLRHHRVERVDDRLAGLRGAVRRVSRVDELLDAGLIDADGWAAARRYYRDAMLAQGKRDGSGGDGREPERDAWLLAAQRLDVAHAGVATALGLRDGLAAAVGLDLLIVQDAAWWVIAAQCSARDGKAHGTRLMTALAAFYAAGPRR